MTGSTFDGNTVGFEGGAIHNDGERWTSPTASSPDNTASGDVAGGGAIANSSGSVALSGCAFDGNSTDGFGGGGATDTEQRGGYDQRTSTFTGNSDSGYYGGGAVENKRDLVDQPEPCCGATSAGSGGGIWNNGTATVQGSRLDGNSATNGGGIDILGELTASMTRSATTSRRGRGRRRTRSKQAGSSMTLDQVKVSGNQGRRGGQTSSAAAC